jgi:hypothetical protein
VQALDGGVHVSQQERIVKIVERRSEEASRFGRIAVTASPQDPRGRCGRTQRRGERRHGAGF